jgi:Flp pilus assembly protein TadG
MPQPHITNLKHERGQTMVEFAVVLPVLALLLFGVIQFGIAFNNYVTLTDAVRAGARKAAVSREASDPVGAATTEVRSSAAGLDLTQLNVSVSSTWQPGSDVTVQASYPYSIHLLGLYDFSGQLNSKTTERLE